MASKRSSRMINTRYSSSLFCQNNLFHISLSLLHTTCLQDETKDEWAMRVVWGPTPWAVYAQSHVSVYFQGKECVWTQPSAVLNLFCTVWTVLRSRGRDYWAAGRQDTQQIWGNKLYKRIKYQSTHLIDIYVRRVLHNEAFSLKLKLMKAHFNGNTWQFNTMQ